MSNSNTQKKYKLKDTLLALFGLVFISLIAYLWLTPSGLNVAPNVTLTTVKGDTIQLDSFRGQPLLVTFWATSCTGCIREMPHLIDMHHKYASQGLKIIGISMPYDRPDHVMKMVEKKKLPYTIAMDINKKATAAFGHISLTPTTFLIAPNGTIVFQKIGEFNTQTLIKLIEPMLAQANSLKSNAPLLKPANDVRKN